MNNTSLALAGQSDGPFWAESENFRGDPFAFQITGTDVSPFFPGARAVVIDTGATTSPGDWVVACMGGKHFVYRSAGEHRGQLMFEVVKTGQIVGFTQDRVERLHKLVGVIDDGGQYVSLSQDGRVLH